MMTRTPAKPTKSPATASGDSRWPRKSRPRAATQSGRALAMIAAKPASTGLVGEVEEPEVERVLADAEDDDRPPLGRGQPDALARGIADAERQQPRARKRTVSTRNSGRFSTTIRDEVKAELQIVAKARPSPECPPVESRAAPQPAAV